MISVNLSKCLQQGNDELILVSVGTEGVWAVQQMDVGVSSSAH